MTKMSDQNVAMVKEGYAAFARGDMGAVLALLDPEIEVWQSETVPWGGTYRGLEEFQTFVTRLSEHVQSEVEGGELLDAGDLVVMIGRSSGRAKKTGADFDVPVVHLWTIRADKLARLEVHMDTAQMLEALASSAVAHA
jgi:ketosteroid isomerase-like protein